MQLVQIFTTTIFVVCIHASSLTRDEKIVGGVEASVGELPHQVALTDNGRFFCGGSIISPLHILTAAHCLSFQNLDHLRVIAGIHDLTGIRKKNPSSPSSKQQIRKGISMRIHPLYNTRTLRNDIAILVLDEPLLYTSRVKNIALPRQNEHFSGSACVSGWGSLVEGGVGSDKLRKVTVPIVPPHICRRSYRTVTAKMLCLGKTGKDSCQGDSGGAALCSRRDSTLVNCGIVSFGYGCGAPGYPGVYTKVSKYVNWINSVLKTSQG